MFDATIENLETDRVVRYRISRDRSHLTYAAFLDLLSNDSGFRNDFTALLADSPFSGYRWETPALTRDKEKMPFEFVLISSPGFCSRQSDAKTYHSYFTTDDANHGVVTFTNLRGDATLIVPSPLTDHGAYGHLAAFIRHAPKAQLDAFWRTIGTTVQSQISDTPLWLNTAGGGVAWLHVRIDSQPKYYAHLPYKRTL